MSTTSNALTVIDALVTQSGALMVGALSEVTVASVWPGGESTVDMLLLGEITWEGYEIACIKAGRKQRDEEAEVAFEVWSLGADGTTPGNPGNTRDRAFAVLAVVENILANDPRLGLGNTVLWVQIRPTKAEPRTLSKGWAWRITGTIAVKSRLT